ncbi:MAG: glycosyltransferase family 2 protein [Phycisphaerales bacterium]
MKLSVIIPMHNAGATIARALDSLRSQRVGDWQAIIVDDGSRDAGAGARIVEHAAEHDGRIRLIRQENGGVCSARNRGLDEARGEWVLFLDADDWMLPGGVDALLLAGERAGGGGAIGTFEMIGADGVLSVEGPWSDEIAWNHLLGGIFMTTHGHVVERRFYEAPTPLRFDAELPLIEDTDLWIRLAERGVRWANAHAPVAAYLMRPDSRSVKFAHMLACTVRVYRSAFERARAATARGDEPARALDTSEERLERLLGHAALGYATRLAISDDGRVESACTLMRDTPGLKRFEPRQLARSGRHAVMFALGARPTAAEANAEPPAWWTRLNAWWEACEREGWVAPGGGAAAARVEFDAADAAQRAGTPTGSGSVSAPAHASQMAPSAQPAPVFGR